MTKTTIYVNANVINVMILYYENAFLNDIGIYVLYDMVF